MQPKWKGRGDIWDGQTGKRRTKWKNANLDQPKDEQAECKNVGKTWEGRTNTTSYSKRSCLSVHLSIGPFVRPSISLSVCLYVLYLFRRTILDVLECNKSSNGIVINEKMSDDEVVRCIPAVFILMRSLSP